MRAANRLAHLYFIRERLKRQSWLVNLYFTDDPIGPADHDAWDGELQKVKASLGLTSKVPFAIDLFLPALTSGEGRELKVSATIFHVPSDCFINTDMSLPLWFNGTDKSFAVFVSGI